MKRLSVGEWRLFLLSDCVKYFPDVEKHTRKLRAEGKGAILQIDASDAKELNNFISKDEVQKIRGLVKKEWRFTGKVVDNGRGRKTTCEYCQKQQIRYKYLCRNDKTDMWLALGSVCVGYVIHGEDKMKDKNFATNFVSELDKLKGNSKPENQPEIDYDDVRKKQASEIKLYVNYLRSRGYKDSDFIKSLQKQWNEGKILTNKQMDALKNMCKKVKYGKVGS